MITTALLVALSAADFDLVIRNAQIVDGSGKASFRGDVGLALGKIRSIGNLGDKSATKTIDAKGLVLAPGFIDIHTHAEGGIDTNPRADNFLRDGVTSIITGNCGSSRVNLGEWFTQLEKYAEG